MADWQRTLHLADVWQKFKSDDCEEPVEKLALVIADRLEGLKPLGAGTIERERKLLVEEFRAFGQSEDDNRDKFGSLMSCLYDWADTPLDDNWHGKKVCWVATF